MPIYEVECCRCGNREVFAPKPMSFQVGFCPLCGRPAPKRISHAGLPPFKSYWTEAFVKPGDKKSLPIRVDSREQEHALCKEHGWERTK